MTESVRVLVCCFIPSCRTSCIDTTSADVRQLYGRGLLRWVCEEHDPGGKRRAYTKESPRKTISYEATVSRLKAAGQL